MAARSLSWHLGMLVFIAAAPLLVLAAALLGWTALATRQAAESGLREAARALGTAVEREVAVWTGSLYQLAASPGFDCNPSDAFQSRAREIAARYGAWVVLGGPDGRERMTTLQAPQRGQALRAVRPGVSDVVTDRVSGARAVFVAVPVASARNAFCWLSLGVPAERLGGLVEPD
ncbi:MAG TPA: hypothetical protein VHG88_12100, partial [Burkholderiales bacterium]|nr:hypothetical protein [Burkholderiales bacterium]